MYNSAQVHKITDHKFWEIRDFVHVKLILHMSVVNTASKFFLKDRLIINIIPYFKMFNDIISNFDTEFGVFSKLNRKIRIFDQLF